MRFVLYFRLCFSIFREVFLGIFPLWREALTLNLHNFLSRRVFRVFPLGMSDMLMLLSDVYVPRHLAQHFMNFKFSWLSC